MLVGYKNSFFMLFAALISCFAVTSCMSNPSALNYKKVQLKESTHVVELPASEVNSNAMENIVRHYNRFGIGDLNLTITYNPKSKENTALQASGNVRKISRILQKKGLTNIKSSILPVFSEESRVLVEYTAVTAHAPQGCTRAPGMQGEGADAMILQSEYQLGCELENMVARQVARPKDMIGVGGSESTEGGRAHNILQPYQKGDASPELEGWTASDVE